MANATTLVEFLRARLDEQAAPILVNDAHAPWCMDGSGYVESGACFYCGEMPDPERVHYQEKPAYVLADVEAKRRIVELHLNNDEGQTGTCSTCTDRNYLGLVDDEWPCPTLRLLALPFASHPDYDPSWRPEEVTA